PPVKYRKPQGRISLFRELARRAQALPGVSAAGMVFGLPMQGSSSVNPIVADGVDMPFVERPIAQHHAASPEYFGAIGIRLRQGRLFDLSGADLYTAVISERAAQKAWPGQNPIGKQFWRGQKEGPPIRVVGVVSDVRADGLEKDPPLTTFFPYT